MSRLSKQITIAGALGVVTTVAVAWTLALCTWVAMSLTWTSLAAQPTFGTQGMNDPAAASSAAWLYAIDERPGVSTCLSWTSDSEHRASPRGSVTLGRKVNYASNRWEGWKRSGTAPPRWSTPWRDDPRADSAHGAAFYHDLVSGWPLYALRWTKTITTSPEGTSESLSGGFSRPQWIARHCQATIVPFAPILSGFVGNAFLFSAGWFVLLFGFANTRRMFRRRGGSCLRCGYDLRGDLERGCPECGWRRSP